MTHQLLHWEQVLRQAGYRATQQRAAILDAVCCGGGHKAIDEIFATVRRRESTTVDRSTVYRALRLFVQLGLVVEASTPGAETRYEVKKLRPHHHLVCQQCGAEREVENDALLILINEIARRHRFQVTNDHLVLHGVCEACTHQRGLS